MAADKADIATVAVSYVPQIRTAHDAYVKNGQDALTKAVEAGRFLTEAKEVVKKSGLSWTEWRGHHFPKIPQTTASLYMRLYENRDGLTSNGVANLAREGKLSVRGAAALVKKPPTQEQLAERAANKLERDAEKKVKAARPLVEQLRELKDAGPVAELLRRAFPDADFIATLIEVLSKDQPKTDTLAIPPELRRTQPEQVRRI
jgi:hypothetical protein